MSEDADEIRLGLTVKQRPLYDIIRRRPGLTAEQLAHEFYASDIAGGPLSANASIRKTVHRINARLSAHGMRIVGGYERCGYRIIAAVEGKA